jgi:hypothetical protein
MHVQSHGLRLLMLVDCPQSTACLLIQQTFPHQTGVLHCIVQDAGPKVVVVTSRGIPFDIMLA